MTRADEHNAERVPQPRPHERIPRGLDGTSCAVCIFGPEHPVHHHRADVVDLAAARARREARRVHHR